MPTSVQGVVNGITALFSPIQYNKGLKPLVLPLGQCAKLIRNLLYSNSATLDCMIFKGWETLCLRFHLVCCL